MMHLGLTFNSVCISLQAPSTTTFDEDAHSCLVLFSATDCQNGQRLSDWVKLQVIAEDIEHLRQKLTHKSRHEILTREAIVEAVSDISKRLDETEFTTLERMNGTYCNMAVNTMLTRVYSVFQDPFPLCEVQI